MIGIPLRLAILACLGVMFAGPAAAQQFPAKPITLIVPWPPGGPTDTQMRALARATEKYLGQNIRVENRPGASGNVSTEDLAYMLDGLGIYKHFAVVYGGNSFDHKKPDPVGVFQILSDTKGNRERTWMVGDSSVDVLTGRNAGVRSSTRTVRRHRCRAGPPEIARRSDRTRSARGLHSTGDRTRCIRAREKDRSGHPTSIRPWKRKTA
jgi:hypothetical protein